jgi:hypothetical protein
MSMGEVLTGAIFQYHGKLINLKKGYLIRGKKGKDKNRSEGCIPRCLTYAAHMQHKPPLYTPQSQAPEMIKKNSKNKLPNK